MNEKIVPTEQTNANRPNIFEKIGGVTLRQIGDIAISAAVGGAAWGGMEAGTEQASYINIGAGIVAGMTTYVLLETRRWSRWMGKGPVVPQSRRRKPAKEEN